MKDVGFEQKRELPMVSIVIPVYNGSNYLRQAIDSSLNQTYGNIEIIVVNDGSSDDGKTEDIALSYGDRIRYFRKENGGSSSALNYGISKMTGQWFSWLSHDDRYLPSKVEREMAWLQEHSVPNEPMENQICFCACDLIGADGSILRKAMNKKEQKKSQRIEAMSDNDMLIAEQSTAFAFNGCGCLIHKNCLLRAGCFDESLRLLNDVDLWYRLFANGCRVHYVPEALVQGRMHTKQISQSIGFSYHNEEQDAFWERTFQYVRERDSVSLLHAFGKSAFSKTRTAEGKKAFRLLSEKASLPEKVLLWLEGGFLRCKAALWSWLKQSYRRMVLR